MSEVMYEVRTVRSDLLMFYGTFQECAAYLKEVLGALQDPDDFRIEKVKGGDADG